jgi:hypothetical protein
MTRFRSTFFILVVVFCCAQFSYAAPITVPTDLNPGDPYRLAFVSSTVRDATSVIIADYDNHVSSAVGAVTELAALSTTWQAIGSTPTVDAVTHIGNFGVPIYNLQSTRIGNNEADLFDGSLLSPISVDENGTLPADFFVWTGSTPAGLGNITNTELGGSSGSSIRGRSNQSGPPWIFSDGSVSTNEHHLYAISAVLTVPPPIPEPSTLVLFLAGILGVSGFGYVRKKRHSAEL